MIRYKHLYITLFVCFLNASARYVASLECYSCSDIENVNNCTNIAQCSSGQLCYQNSNTAGPSQTYTLGCIDKHQCSTLGGGSPVLVGGDLFGRQTNLCHECCSTDNCNKHLCEHFKPSTCIDDVKIDCGFLNTVTNICQDIQHAKTICPKFCDLCSLVDGMWSEWTSWSDCDVTCDNGTQTRTRTCTNPRPSNGGLNCSGSMTDVKACHKQLCPVHGGWTKWSDWEACSVSCDTGIQRRHRNCTNPFPSRFGDHCFGDSVDVQLCKPGTCSATIAFNARDVRNTVLIQNQIVIFTNIVFNIGGGYNKSTGYFTAPVPGTYSFTLHVCKSSSSSLDVAIVIDGAKYVIHSMRASGMFCGSVSTFAVLNRGQKVSIQTVYPGSNGFYQEQNYERNTFSGALVH